MKVSITNINVDLRIFCPRKKADNSSLHTMTTVARLTAPLKISFGSFLRGVHEFLLARYSNF